MKKCSRCGAEKPLSEFQVRRASHDGLTASCKACLSDYDKARANLPHRVMARKEYQKTQAYRNSSAKSSQKFRLKYPVKYRAHNIVNNAIRDNKLFKEPCEVCGSSDNVHAHHDDYLKPLNIRWLCDSHHREWHKEHGEAKNGRGDI